MVIRCAFEDEMLRSRSLNASGDPEMIPPNDNLQVSISRWSRRRARRTSRLRSSKFLPAVNGLESRTLLSSIPTSTALSASTTTALYGQLVDFTATVSANAASKTQPTGTVQFEIDGASYGKPVPLSGGKAGISDAALPSARIPSRPFTSRPTALSPPAPRPALRRRSPPTRPPPRWLLRSIRPALASPSAFTATVANSSVHGGSTPTGSVQFQIDGHRTASPCPSVAARPASATRPFPSARIPSLRRSFHPPGASPPAHRRPSSRRSTPMSRPPRWWSPRPVRISGTIALRPAWSVVGTTRP